MQASVKIMDIDVDMLSNDVFIEKINEYLTDERLEVILFASTELLNYAVQEEEYREVIDRAELVLPGEEALLSAYHADVLEAGDMVVSCKSFGMVLEKLKKEDRTIYILSKGEEDIRLLTGYCKRMQPELKIVGDCSYSEDLDDAAIVNEINSHIPDILLVDLPTGMQEKWIMEHVSLLNAKLCIAIGGVAGLIMAQEKKTPMWIKRLHLDGLYHKLVREQTVKKDFRARIFRKKVVQYNNQIDEKKDDN
ncbi:MAG: WecB/TagA/CpsF family glycosyltransferase [Butyribacter sp.]|nr:WecB/TagA/CpsF family glycosyltransferase [bacterium]MDY3854109.1 WecB/TagA/CpsF family glycosyltransferase [Butyribacter sp.]